MKMFTCKFAQDEVTHQRLRGRFKKTPSRPVLRPLEGKAAAILTRGAYAEYVSTEKW